MDQDIKNRIEARISQGDFLVNMLHSTRHQSDEAQSDFVGRLSRIAATVRALIVDNGMLRKLPYSPTSYWPGLRGKVFAFIDGGVASIDLPSTAPVGIRVGSYIVRPGDTTDEREKFNIELALVDDLFSQSSSLYDDYFSDVAKLRDAARIISEVSAGYRVAKVVGKDQVDGVILHGPLINPVSPYGLDDFPSFELEACQTFLDAPDWEPEEDERDRHFMSIYQSVLERAMATKPPLVGVVERSIGRDPVFMNRMLRKLRGDGILKQKEAERLDLGIKELGLNDAALLDVVLGDGEYVAPIAIDRQGPESKWPKDWTWKIRDYPKALTTYLKPSAMVLPFRIEAFENIKAFDDIVNLIFHTSRLLPTYGFPVGLDIVDRFAKVPSWLSRGVKGQHQVVLLRRAIESGNPDAVAFAKRVLAAKRRDWLFRPDA